jgi:ATP/maltotriose-dependent transcriptional regulator MalT
MVEVTGNVLVAADQVEVERYSAKAQTQLGDAAFTRLWQDGRLWTYEQASEQAHRLSAKIRFERAHVLSDDQLEPLHDRELEVLRLMADGRSNREIAERLVVTLSTVKWHSNNLFGKLGVRSRTQAVARARELGVL